MATRTVETACPSCGMAMTTAYVRLGTAIRCPGCSEIAIPEMSKGASHPDTGFEISYYDFWYFLECPSYRKSVAPLMAEWFRYDVADTAAGVRLVNAGGEALDTLWVHLRIQADHLKQRELYGVAMGLWR
jgi:hypothetical protein